MWLFDSSMLDYGYLRADRDILELYKDIKDSYKTLKYFLEIIEIPKAHLGLSQTFLRLLKTVH